MEQTRQEELKEILNELDNGDREFAESLLRSVHPSEKQIFWMNVLIKKVRGPIKAQVGDLQGVIALIDRNNKAVYPKINIIANDLLLQVSKASSYSKYPKSITICKLLKATDNRGHFVGRVHLSGIFEPHHRLNDIEQKEIIEGIKALVNDPAGVARAFGYKTGHCCFCRLPLNDERSLFVGYGAKCAKNYLLPWGSRPEKEIDQINKLALD